MAALAENTLDRPRVAQRAARVVLVLAGIVAVAGLAWWLKGLASSDPAPKRQVARIAILPDAPPPPPPPPPRELPRPQEQSPQPTPDAPPKPADAPPQAAETLKMEGAAGDGPSAFAAGPVTREYQGGPVVAGSPGGGAARVDRAQERLYAQGARQLLRDEIERRLRSDAVQLTATFSVWLRPDGDIERVELAAFDQPAHEADLRAALDELQRQVRLPQPPESIAQPMRFRLTVRPQG